MESVLSFTRVEFVHLVRGCTTMREVKGHCEEGWAKESSGGRCYQEFTRSERELEILTNIYS